MGTVGKAGDTIGQCQFGQFGIIIKQPPLGIQQGLGAFFDFIFQAFEPVIGIAYLVDNQTGELIVSG